MKIPKSFKIMNKTINVEFDEKVRFKENAKAINYLDEDRMVIQSDSSSCPVKKEHIEHSFLHELVHWILYVMDEDYKNEKYVEVFSGLLHQALITMEYDK